MGADDGAGRHAVLLVDGSSPAAGAIVRTLGDLGIDHVTTQRWTVMVELLTEHHPDIVVLELALAGTAGIRLVSMVRATVPSALVVAVSDLEAINLAAVEAGATLVVQPSDLRPLSALLRQQPATPGTDS